MFISEKGGKWQPNMATCNEWYRSTNHARIYLGLHANPSVCSRSSSLLRNGQLRSVCSHSCPTCQWYAKRRCVDRLAYAYLVLNLHTTPPSVTVYRARFIMMHFSQCISTTRDTLDAFGLMLNYLAHGNRNQLHNFLSMYSVLLPPFLDIRCIDFWKKFPKYKVYCVATLVWIFFWDLITFPYIMQAPLFSYIN